MKRLERVWPWARKSSRSRYIDDHFGDRSDIASRLAIADRLRDNRQWLDAAEIYVTITERANGLFAQVGNCHKEAGNARRAAVAYLAVTGLDDRWEAIAQLGRVLRQSGHRAQALACFAAGAKRNISWCQGEFERLETARDPDLRWSFFEKPQADGSLPEATEIEGIRLALCCDHAPLDWRNQLSFAEWLLAAKKPGLADFFTECALVIGGTGRKQEIANRLGTSGIPHSYVQRVEACADKTATAALAASLQEKVLLAVQRELTSHRKLNALPANDFRLLDAVSPEHERALQKVYAAIFALSDALFKGDPSRVGPALDALDAGLLLFGEHTFLTLPDDTGRLDIQVLALRIARQTAERIASHARIAMRQSEGLSAFGIPWGRGSLALHELGQPLDSGTDALTDELASGTSQSDFGPERLEILQIGWQRTKVGTQDCPRLVGVIAIRARCIAFGKIQMVHLRLGGKAIATLQPPVSGVDSGGRKMTYVNTWFDTATWVQGAAKLEIAAEMADGTWHTKRETVFVDQLKPGESYTSSDSFILDPPPGETAEARVLSLPVIAHPSRRSLIAGTIRSVLVMRLDQLGDVAASLDGMRRLRAHLPEARFEALVTPANAYLVSSSGLFDEVVAVDFTYDHATRRRKLSEISRAEIIARYGQTGFDLAVDLAPGHDSRPILKLIDARCRAGFKPFQFPFLDFGVEIETQDRFNRRQCMSHTSMISGFVEALIVALAPPPARFLPAAGLEKHLESMQLSKGEYIALHTGARLAIRRWPLDHYLTLAHALCQKTDKDVVVIADDPLTPDAENELRAEPRIKVLTGRVDFALFDAILSHAAVFVGNDTGPKHFASTRGVRTVSIHMGQLNWNEWGQDGEGVILAKRVPCVGCAIEDLTECGKDLVCLTSIEPQSVVAAVLSELQKFEESRKEGAQ